MVKAIVTTLEKLGRVYDSLNLTKVIACKNFMLYCDTIARLNILVLLLALYM